MLVNITYAEGVCESNPRKEGVFVVGKKVDLKKLATSADVISKKFGTAFDLEHFRNGVEGLSPKPSDTVQLYLKNFTVAALPEKASRHNAPMFPHMLAQLLLDTLPRAEEESIVIVCDRKSAFALGLAVARVFPYYNQKTSSAWSTVNVIVEFILTDDGEQKGLSNADVSILQAAAKSVRLSAKIVDMPCNIMHTDAFLDEIHHIAKKCNIEPLIIQGKDLEVNGFGGLYGVGKAAVHQPALAVLSYHPNGATKNIAWCGKGIVYDTGGLSIKDKINMPGMKRDCGGAAAILGAFQAAVQAGFKENLHAVFCLAENAVGPTATRPDDVHTLYSGLTVEVNNTDAEGRLVLGDGVAYAKKNLKADIIVDMATLTGAQGIATGKYHAAILTNNEDWEVGCVQAGKISGDLVHPVPYSPELHFEEFNSSVADMKNSAKCRNASVSCAGLFIGRHIGFDYPGVWLHIDMAAPTYTNERATGYGVALLLTLFGKHTSNPLLLDIAPSL